MRFAIFSNRPARLLNWPLALALSAATCAPAASAAAASTRSSMSVKSPASVKSVKAVKSAKPTAPRRVLKSEARSLALASATVETINAAQLEIATRVLTGDVQCEFNQHITVQPEPNQPGYFSVSLKNQRYRMLPRETTTGAVRLEDPAAGIVWLQIPTKSMLMNTRIGQRLVDACTHTEQRVALAAVADAANALGILPTAALPPEAAASAAAAALAGAAASTPVATAEPAAAAASSPATGTIGPAAAAATVADAAAEGAAVSVAAAASSAASAAAAAAAAAATAMSSTLPVPASGALQQP